MVPIVTGERRKAEEPKPEGTRRYRRRSPNAPRLCADDIMNRVKLKAYQTSYAEAMRKYGLKRGIDGSQARHIPASEFYRDVFLRQNEVREQVEAAYQQYDKVNELISKMYDHRDEAQEKFLKMEKRVQEKEVERQKLEETVKLARQRIEADGPVKVYMEQQRQIEQLKDELAEIHRLFPELKQRLIDKRNELYQEDVNRGTQRRGMKL